LPTPLPLHADPVAATKLLAAGLQTAQSPRGQQSDGGAMLVRLVFARYARDLGWTLPATADTAAAATASDAAMGTPAAALAQCRTRRYRSLAARVWHGCRFMRRL